MISCHLTSYLFCSTFFGLLRSFILLAIGYWLSVRLLTFAILACLYSCVFSSIVHACSFLAVVHAEKELAERARSHSQHGLPLLTTALHVDDGLTAFHEGVETAKSNGSPDSPPTTERPTSSNSTEIAEVNRKSKEYGVLVTVCLPLNSIVVRP